MTRGAAMRAAGAAVAAAAALGASAATGYWSSPSAPGGGGTARADALPAGNTPTVSAVGPSVTIQWSPNSFSGATLGYALTRYASSAGSPSGAAIAVACSPSTGPGGTLQCVDGGVPPGTWQYTVAPSLNSWRGAESAPSAAVNVYNDTTPPVTSAVPAPATPASGWYRAGPVNLTLAATDNTGGSGVAAVRYTLDGSDPRTSAGALTYVSPIAIGSTATVRFAARDNANNWEAAQARTIQIDTQPPAGSLSLTGVSGGAFLSGATLFYRGAAAGSFAIANAVSDSGGSGPASSATAPLAGTASGWTHTAGTVSTPNGGPYVSAAFSWAAGTLSSPSETVTAADLAGNTTASPPLTFRNDSSAPTTTASASPAPNAAGWSNAAVSVTLASADNAGGSGVAAIRYTTDGSSPLTSPTALTYSAPITLSATTTVRFAATDNVGNAEAVRSQTVNVDTVAPANGLALGNVTGGAYLSGATLFYRGAAAGSFTLSNTVTDADSGPASSATAALAGGASGWTHSPSTATTPTKGAFISNPFSWLAGTLSSPTETVTGADLAGNTTAATIGFVNDSAPPSGTVSFPAAAAYATGSGWNAGCGTPAAGDVCGDAGDAGSGLASVSLVLTRASDGKCWNPAAGRFQPAACSGVPPTTLTPGASPAWAAAFPCAVDSYTLDVTLRDNVGNAAALPQRAWQITSCLG